jgi:hypothetical protein
MSRKYIISTKTGLSLCLYGSETTVGIWIMHALKIILLLKFRNNVIKTQIFQDVTPSVEAEWLTLLRRILDFPGSNLDLETGYSDSGLSCFPQSLHANAGTVP